MQLKLLFIKYDLMVARERNLSVTLCTRIGVRYILIFSKCCAAVIVILFGVFMGYTLHISTNRMELEKKKPASDECGHTQLPRYNVTRPFNSQHFTTSKIPFCENILNVFMLVFTS